MLAQGGDGEGEGDEGMMAQALEAMGGGGGLPQVGGWVGGDWWHDAVRG
jgi:hypothetical protein